MPLISCPTCTHEISDQALACPKCGHPMKEQAVSGVPLQQEVVRKGGRYELIGTLVVVSGMIIGMAWSGAFGAVLFITGLCVFIYGRFY
jgi:hypothetical protein